MTTRARPAGILYRIAKDEIEDAVKETGELDNLLIEEHGRGIPSIVPRVNNRCRQTHIPDIWFIFTIRPWEM